MNDIKKPPRDAFFHR